jgi:hypothetical protein
MTDGRKQLQTLCAGAAECKLISNLATAVLRSSSETAAANATGDAVHLECGPRIGGSTS